MFDESMFDEVFLIFVRTLAIGILQEKVVGLLFISEFLHMSFHFS